MVDVLSHTPNNLAIMGLNKAGEEIHIKGLYPPHVAVRLFFLFSSPTWAQTVQAFLWNVPDGKLSDFSQTFTAGNTLSLSWNALITTTYVDTTKNLVDLWVTSYDTSVSLFSQRVTQNINLTSSRIYAWTIAIPEETLAVGAKYVLRFKAASSTYDLNSGELSSPGFIVLRAAPLTTSTSSSSTSSSLFSTIATAITPPPSQTATTDQYSISGGLSSGAKVGIGISVAVGVLGVFGIVYIFIRRRRRGVTLTETIGTQVDYKHGSTTHPAELPGTSRPAELATELATERVA
ncbi:hypothetical protein B0O99DRAFT_591481 [Bisporella sp. PMI_857]|nr:hypothetical protein B0O99DRAFT_591481 [Bisporella sp. PMI_857]